MAGPRPVLRCDDGRVARGDRTREQLGAVVLAELIDRGVFQPKVKQLEAATGKNRGTLHHSYPAKPLLMKDLARRAPGRIVDALQLPPEDRAALSPRAVQAIAWAVLVGQRKERGT